MQIKARLSNQTVPIEVTQEGNRLAIKSRYHPKLIPELKALEGARWSPEDKMWYCDHSERNIYSLSTLERNDQRYSLNFHHLLTEKDFSNAFKHQIHAINEIVLRKRVIIAGQMGIGKTFIALSAMNYLNRQVPQHFWIVCPKSAKYSWQSEILKWHFSLREDQYGPGTFRFVSYNELERLLCDTPESQRPQGIFFDEAHLLKNPEAKRTQAAIILGSLIRNKDGVIVLLTGTPAPKDPTDWWSLTEICQAGYLRESSKNKLKYRLGEWETNPGVEYKTLKSWNQDEIRTLYLRLKGLVHIYLKKDCLDLPDKEYIPVKIPLDESTLKQLKLLTTLGGKGVTTLSKLRQRSDGFQYHSSCPKCLGEGEIFVPLIEGKTECPECKGEGGVVAEIHTPKDEQLIQDLKDFEEQEINRVVIYAAYHKSIDKICKILADNGWSFIRLDGRGLLTSNDIDGSNWQHDFNGDGRQIAFVGHPKAGGLGLNLQKAEYLIFYSNDFDGAARPQAEDRIHRIGTTKAVIKDYLWLPTDYFILENLMKKKSLQSVSLGEIQEFIDNFSNKKYWEL